VVRLMPKQMGKGCKAATRIAQQTTWLESAPKTQRVFKTTAPPQDDSEKEKQIEFEEQRAIWSREGVFWSKRTETFEVRREGYPSMPVSDQWFFNKINGKLEMYGDIRQPPVTTKEAVFFEKHKK